MASKSSFPPSALRELVQEVANLLKERKETVSVAETAAGGILSASVLSVPGASKIYLGGLTLYTLDSRIAFAGWTQDNVKNYKGPTPEVVAGLAVNVRAKLGSTYTICESGTAGPANHAFSGTLARNRTPLVVKLNCLLEFMLIEDDSGYVALAIASQDGVVTREVETGQDDREKNMVVFAEEGLKFLRDVLKGEVKVQSGKL